MIELREASGGKLVLEGHPSVFDVWYPVGSFDERVSPGSFKRTLAQGPDVVLLQDHSDLALARTKTPSGKPSLRLSETDHGLFCEADLDPSAPRVQDLRSTMENCGLQMSFGFRCTADSWDDSGARSRRDIKGVELHHGDVTVCNFGANEATDSSISERNGPLSTTERRELAKELRGRLERRMAPDLTELRAGYAAHELGQLGGEGKAFKRADGGWSFPTKTQSDLEDAVRMVGLSGSDHNAVRRYLRKRALEMGLSRLIPMNWAKDGSARSLYLPDYTTRAAQELELMRMRAGEWRSRPHGTRKVSVTRHLARAERDLAELRRAAGR